MIGLVLHSQVGRGMGLIDRSPLYVVGKRFGPPTCLLVRLSFRLSVRPSVYLSVYMSFLSCQAFLQRAPRARRGRL